MTIRATRGRTAQPNTNNPPKKEKGITIKVVEKEKEIEAEVKAEEVQIKQQVNGETVKDKN